MPNIVILAMLGSVMEIMVKYLVISSFLVLGINLIRTSLVVLVSWYYKKKFKDNIALNPKELLADSLVLIVILAVSFWGIDSYLSSNYVTILLFVLLASLIPSYDYILSPLKYMVFKKEYRKSPELEEAIRQKGFDYNVFIIKGKTDNAYATGVLPFSKTILVGEHLQKNMTEDSLLSIVYHEIGHLKLNHLTKLYFISFLLSVMAFVAFYTMQYFLGKIESPYLEPLSIFLLGMFIGICFWYLPGKIQYKLELEADYFAAQIVGPEGYEKALNELDSLSGGDVSKGGITHPRLSERIKNIFLRR